VRGYAETDDCRRRYILNYFGEEYEPRHCDRCDNDVFRERKAIAVGAGPEPAAPSTGRYRIGQRVVHAEWGEGEVQRVEPDALTVLFERTGYKTLALDVVEARGLLDAAED
jgi:ATP-dependent DNA helicase RecQ